MQSTLVFSKRVEYYAKRIFIIYCETVSHSNVDFGRASGVYGRSRARKGEESRMQMRQIDRESESENEVTDQLSSSQNEVTDQIIQVTVQIIHK